MLKRTRKQTRRVQRSRQLYTHQTFVLAVWLQNGSYDSAIKKVSMLFETKETEIPQQASTHSIKASRLDRISFPLPWVESCSPVQTISRDRRLKSDRPTNQPTPATNSPQPPQKLGRMVDTPGVRREKFNFGNVFYRQFNWWINNSDNFIGGLITNFDNVFYRQ